MKSIVRIDGMDSCAEEQIVLKRLSKAEAIVTLLARDTASCYHGFSYAGGFVGKAMLWIVVPTWERD